MTTTILPDDRCPSCGYVLDACAPRPSNDRERPSPGDITLCFGCGEVLFFDAQMKHQLLPPPRVEALDPELLHIVRVGQEAIRSRRLPRAAGRA
jgi:hypothetical protein